VNRHRSAWVVAAALLSALTATGCHDATAQATDAVTRQSSPAAIEQARLDSIRRPYTRADIDFMSGMIAHHAQAVEMAHWAASHGASPSVLIYTGRVAMAQTAEIELMQTWLRDRRQPVPAADPKGMKMVVNGQTMTMMMPGMLTEDQMKLLDAARGREWDRLFLTFMIQHHQGAISMVETLMNTDGAAQDEFTFKFANDVQADQATEIDRMQQMLETMARSN